MLLWRPLMKSLDCFVKAVACGTTVSFGGEADHATPRWSVGWVVGWSVGGREQKEVGNDSLDRLFEQPLFKQDIGTVLLVPLWFVCLFWRHFLPLTMSNRF